MSALAPLVLIGAGGLGREVLEVVRAINAIEPTWAVRGFVDDDPTLAGTSVAGVTVLGPLSAIEADDAVAICTARPGNRCSRRHIAAALALDPDRTPVLVHPAASLGRSVELGPGCLVMAGAVATADVTIGSHAVVMPQAVLTHDDRIGDFVTFAAGVRLGGGVEVGDEAYLGAGALVREHVVIGPAALIGMGSVVLTDVGGGETWVGSPARRLERVAVPA